jgi:branched-chain amino acid aminotransferase
MRLVYIDGERFGPAEAKISVYDRGFLYGDSVFETIRTYGGKLFALEMHIDRLEESAAKMHIALPVDKATIVAETRRAVEEANNPESYARVMLTRGGGPLGLDTDLADGPTRVILVEPLQMPPKEHYERGIAAACIETVRASDAADSAKLGNYLASVLALRKAKEAGAVEALVVNRDGLVVEGTTSNIFAVVRGGLVTPPLDIGILAGITRAEVLAAAAELGIPVDERAMTATELYAVDELFITSSIREVLPVVVVDGHTIGTGTPGSITRRLHRAFRARVGLAKLPFE